MLLLLVIIWLVFTPSKQPSKTKPSTTIQSTKDKIQKPSIKTEAKKDPHLPPGFPNPPKFLPDSKQADRIIKQGDALIEKTDALIKQLNLPVPKPDPTTSAKIAKQKQQQQQKIKDLQQRLNKLKANE